MGNDLTFEQRFLNNLIEKIVQEIEQEKSEQEIVEWEFSYNLHKKSMSICCKTSIKTETIARKLLKLTDRLMEEHFFEKDGLRKLAWCLNYMVNRRTHNYHKNKEFFKKTEIVEFYWFNSSPNRFNNLKAISEVEVCNCMHCRFFMS